jgi:phosphatidylcholine synthase
MSPRIPAALVHVFTASGAACAMLATFALFADNWRAMFAWLGVALVIDALDGPMARRVRIKTHLPRFDGERLDLIIDYITYVFIPALALVRAGYLPGMPGQILAAAILMSALFHFSDTESKTDDNCFVGFPAIWNVVALYIFAFAPPAWLAMGVVSVLVILTFIPLKWVHPVRVTALRPLTAVMCGIWGLAALWIVIWGFPASFVARAALAGCGLYAIGLVAWHGRASLR